MGNLASGRSLYRASFAFFLTRLLTTRIAYHVLMPKEIKHWKLSVNFLHSFLSDLQENHGRSDADGGCTIISVKTPMQQKPWQVAASFLKGSPSLNVWADVYLKLIYLEIWLHRIFAAQNCSYRYLCNYTGFLLPKTVHIDIYALVQCLLRKFSSIMMWNERDLSSFKLSIDLPPWHSIF